MMQSEFSIINLAFALATYANRKTSFDTYMLLLHFINKELSPWDRYYSCFVSFM